MKIITTIIKSVFTLKISTTLDAQTNDGHLFIKQSKTISIPLINIKNNYKPLIHIKHTSITLINNKNNYKPLIHIKHTS